jgi:BirA family biotin operon repressor/biotin-[acetyl-CoA-carboxylase] ligase
VRWFESIDSTNRYLLGEARKGAAEGVVAVADHQTAGRGRLGRRWEAPLGSNLLVSVLLRPDLPDGSRHLASAVVALAAVDAIHETTGLLLGVKWPNDLLGPDGRKVAGVLAEADVGKAGETGPQLLSPIVVGIGINVRWPVAGDVLPADLADRATSLEQLSGAPISRRALLDGLLNALEPRVESLETAEGRSAQAADLRRRCTTLGAQVRVELADRTVEGTAEDVTDQGQLVVVTADGPITVSAGDVVHLRPSM